MESSLGRLTAIALVILIPAGLLLSRLLGRRMGDFRRGHLVEINRVLRDLAATAGGEFESGSLLANHPLLGKLHRYGTARLSAGGLEIEVGVSYPGDDRSDDHTTVRIVAPTDRRWRLAALHLSHPCNWTNDPAAIDAEISRCFEIVGAESVGLPQPARSALVRLGARAFSLDLRDDALELIAAADDGTTYVAPVARLRTLVEQAVEAADALLVPHRGR
jgi:hypothetical protein